MMWSGSGSSPRILALVYYNADTQEWHIGDTTVTREMLENLDPRFAHAAVAEGIGRNTETLRRAIVDDHVLKCVQYGW